MENDRAVSPVRSPAADGADFVALVNTLTLLRIEVNFQVPQVFGDIPVLSQGGKKSWRGGHK